MDSHKNKYTHLRTTELTICLSGVRFEERKLYENLPVLIKYKKLNLLTKI